MRHARTAAGSAAFHRGGDRDGSSVRLHFEREEPISTARLSEGGANVCLGRPEPNVPIATTLLIDDWPDIVRFSGPATVEMVAA